MLRLWSVPGPNSPVNNDAIAKLPQECSSRRRAVLRNATAMQCNGMVVAWALGDPAVKNRTTTCLGQR